MKILATTAGPAPAREKAEYIIKIAKRLNAEIVALHILRDEHVHAECEESLQVFVDKGKEQGINVMKILQQGEVVPTILETSVRVGADLIILGASDTRTAEEGISSDVIDKSDIPVVVIPHAFVLVHK